MVSNQVRTDMRFVVQQSYLRIPLCLVLAVCNGVLVAHGQSRTAPPEVKRAVVTPPAIAEQSLIRTIHEWGGSIAVITQAPLFSQPRRGYRLATVEPGSSRIVPFGGVTCDTYHDVGHSQEMGKFLVCGRGNTAQVYRQIDGSWTSLTAPLQGTAFRSAVDGGQIVLVSENAIYRVSGSSIPTPTPRGIPEFPEAPSTLLLTGNVLYAAFDRGEFGGALYRFDLNQSPMTPTKILADNVRFLARSGSGAVWAASGLAHMIGLRGAVYRIHGDATEVVAMISGHRMTDDHVSETAGLAFPGLTTVDGLTISDDEQPIVVLSELGVFKLTPSGFAPIYQGTLRFSYDAQIRGLDVTVGSSPTGVVTSSTGDIYVASHSLGVFRLRRDASGVLEQLTFAER
jgi:hypothetical protein